MYRQPSVTKPRDPPSPLAKPSMSQRVEEWASARKNRPSNADREAPLGPVATGPVGKVALGKLAGVLEVLVRVAVLDEWARFTSKRSALAPARALLPTTRSPNDGSFLFALPVATLKHLGW